MQYSGGYHHRGRTHIKHPYVDVFQISVAARGGRARAAEGGVRGGGGAHSEAAAAAARGAPRARRHRAEQRAGRPPPPRIQDPHGLRVDLQRVRTRAPRRQDGRQRGHGRGGAAGDPGLQAGRGQAVHCLLCAKQKYCNRFVPAMFPL